MPRTSPNHTPAQECRAQNYPKWVRKLLSLMGRTVRVNDLAILFGKPLTAHRDLCGQNDITVPPLHHALRNMLELFTEKALQHPLDGGCAAKTLAKHLKERQVGQFWLTVNTWLIAWELGTDQETRARLDRLPQPKNRAD